MSEAERECRARLPAAVYDLAIRLGVKPTDSPSTVRLTQAGRMKRNLNTDRWMAFTATQTISTRTCAFDWQANAGPLSMITARDALDHGAGRFDIMALGIVPIARAAHTPALVRGELIRYLAEIPWAPHAIFCNPGLAWRVTDAETLSISAGSGETLSEVLLSLNSDGRIAGAFAPDRPRSAVLPVLPTPWRGRFSSYRFHDGIWLPFAGEVAWEIDGKEALYWQGRIKDWEVFTDDGPTNNTCT